MDTSTRGVRSESPEPEELPLLLSESTDGEEDTLSSSSEESESEEEIEPPRKRRRGMLLNRQSDDHGIANTQKGKVVRFSRPLELGPTGSQ